MFCHYRLRADGNDKTTGQGFSPTPQHRVKVELWLKVKSVRGTH